MSVYGGGVADQRSSLYSKTTLAVVVRIIVIIIVHLVSFLKHVCSFISFYISVSLAD